MRKHPIASICTLFTVILLIIGLHGCTEDYFELDRLQEDFITWEPDIAFPIVYSILTAEDIISVTDTTNIYQYDANNFITLIYRRRIFSQTINDFFQLPQSVTLSNNVDLSPTEQLTFATSGQVQTTLNSTLALGLGGPGGSQLDKMRFHTGTMDISFTSDFEHSGTLLVSMPEMRLNGAAFSQTYPINFVSGPVTVNISIPLQGYEMDLDNGGPANSVPILYTLDLNENPSGAPATSLNEVQIDHSFQNMVMAFADGYFGNFTLEVDPADVDLDVVQSEHSGNIYFEDPKFRLNVKNSIGAEMFVSIDELYATGDPGQVNVDLSALIPGNQFTIPAAPSFGETATLEYLFTQNNSNIKTIINNQFARLHHDVSAQVNSGGPAYNFAGLNSAIEVTADIELPFWGFSDHFTIIDTLEVPFSEGEQYVGGVVERGLLRINTVSHFPVDGLLKVYFADEFYNLTDSILTDGSYIIQSGLVDADGKTITPVNTNNDVELTPERIDNLFLSKYLILRTDLTSTDDAGRNIKLYGEDNIEVRIGLRVKLKGSPSDLNDL